MHRNRLSLGLLAATLSALLACGGSGGGSATMQELVPASTDVAPGEVVRFSLAISPSAAVAWSVEEEDGGTIDAAGNYTAPETEGTFHVLAAHAEGAFRAEVNVRRPDPAGVAIDPARVEVEAGKTVAFQAAVGGDAAADVNWSVEEGAAGGTVTDAGLYTAPATAGTYHVIASSARTPSVTARATIVVTAAPTVPGTGTGTGTTYAPSYVAVTGGGPMPNVADALVASCRGDGATDDTSCLQAALDAAARAGKPLAIPATSSFYRITAPLKVATSVLGTNGQPKIKQTSTCATLNCVGLRLMPNMTGWIYNLNIIGAYTTSRGEFAHNISVGGVNGVTIKGNRLENPIGDAVADNAQEVDGSATARNVLVDGNTMVHTARCMVSLVNVSDRWAIMNNLMDNPTPWVSPIDIEPWQASSYTTNIEIGYNKITTPANPAETQAGNYLGVVAANGWFDPTPGDNIYAHHNYGTWPFAKYVGIAVNAGRFNNVVDTKNVQGNAVPQ